MTSTAAAGLSKKKLNEMSLAELQAISNSPYCGLTVSGFASNFSEKALRQVGKASLRAEHVAKQSMKADFGNETARKNPGFFSFGSSYAEQLRKTNPNLDQKDAISLAAKVWREELTDQQRLHWSKVAEAEQIEKDKKKQQESLRKEKELRSLIDDDFDM